MANFVQRGKHYFYDVEPSFYAPSLKADIEERRASRPSWASAEEWPDISIERTRSGGWYRASWDNGQDYQDLTFLIAAVGAFPIREEGHFQLLHHGGKPAALVAKRLSQACYGDFDSISVVIKN